MSSGSPSLLEFSKQQQSRRVEELKKNVAQPVSVVGTGSGSPSIIKIFPGNCNKVNLPKINVTKFVRAQVPDNLPSTSSSLVSYNVTDAECNANENDNDKEDEGPKIIPIEICGESKQRLQINILKRVQSGNTSVPCKKSKTHSEQCCSCCREMLETILTQQQEILELLKNNSKPTPPISVEKLDLLPTMPFNNINDFLDFDESLSNENVQYQFMVKLNKLLVNTEQKSVSNVMSAILTNELCKGISWIGVKDTIAFGTSNMVGMIVDLIQEHNQVNIDAVKTKIAEWLRRCGDRINNELRKKQKKIEQGYSL